MFKTGRYLYVIFMCHLAIEKTLKACVTEAIHGVPAKTHDLIYLVSKSGLEFSEDHLLFIGKINNASIPTRYPDDVRRMIKEYSKDIAELYLKRTEELVKWLKKSHLLKK